MKHYDPQMHTAEHVLNQAMVKMFGCERSFSSHLEKKKSKCDYRFPRALSGEEEVALASEVNKTLSLNLPVQEHWLEKAEAEKEYDLKRLPESVEEKIRIVTVGDYDACPCIGDHVNNTSEVGTFLLVSSSYDDGQLRLRFKLKKNGNL